MMCSMRLVPDGLTKGEVVVYWMDAVHLLCRGLALCSTITFHRYCTKQDGQIRT